MELHLLWLFDGRWYDMALKLSMFASNITKQVCDCWDGFILFLKNFEEKKACIMLFLMLDQRFKNLKLVSSFIGQEQVVLWWKIMIDGSCSQCY